MDEPQTEYPHLSKAPIVEAVIDFRVKLPSDFKLDAFQPLRTQLAKGYPGFEEQQIVQQMIKQEPGSAAEVSTRFSGIHGYRLLSTDGKNVVQLRRDGFTFSRLNPYTNWDEVFAEAWRLWVLYVEASEPLEVSRIAVALIFDIDAYEDVSLPSDDVTIRERFGKLREMKNRVFFKGLTTKAIDLFR